MPRSLPSDSVLKALREFGLKYPGAHTKSPWPGHLDLAVKDKTFAYLSVEGQPFTISCKLPQSSELALLLPFTKPTGYGLGKSGWVTAEFPESEQPSLELLKAWVDESFRALAPKTLVAKLGPTRALAPPATSAEKKAGRKTAPKPKARAGAKKAGTKKTGTRKAPARAARKR